MLLGHYAQQLRPWVMQIELPLHHLGDVACELNLASHLGQGLGWCK